MTTFRGDFSTPLSRYNSKKRELEAIMLEHHRGMRRICDSRDGAYRYHEKDRHDSPRYALRNTNAWTSSSELGNTRPNPRWGQDSEIYRGFYPGSSTSRIPRNQRPHSFDENELRRNLTMNQHRLRRETKSERPPIVIPSSSLPAVPDASNGSTQDQAKQVRISLVSASDLYDLVDLGLTGTLPQPQDSAKVSNAEDGIRLIEEIEWGRQVRHAHKDPFHLRKTNERPTNSISVEDHRDLLVTKKLRKDVAPSKRKQQQTEVRSTPNPLYVLDKRQDCQDRKGGYTASMSKDVEVYPMDILLKQVTSSHQKNRTSYLKTRPKRAKRMKLPKPELMAIPEDGSTIISASHPRNDSPIATDALSSPRVPLPSSTSLSAIKEVGGRPRNSEHSHHNGSGWHQSRMLRLRDAHQAEDNKHSKRLLRKPKDIRDTENRRSSDVNIDELMLTSIYPTLPWEVEDGLEEKIKHDTLDKSNSPYKDRVQKKMRRLIFLRDQPQQLYKREM